MERLSKNKLLAIIALAIATALLMYVVSEARLPSVTRIVVLAGAAMTLNLLIGSAGLYSMGHGLFVGCGAYFVAVLTIKHGVALPLAIIVALGVSILAGAVAGLLALRARALFFSMLTLALGQVAYVFVARNYELTGGDDGLVGVPLPQILGSSAAQHLLATGVTALLLIVLLMLTASPFGTTLRALRDNPERVASLGGNPKLFQYIAFIVSGLLGTVVGVLAAITDQSVEPGIFSWTYSVSLLVMVALGGRSAFFGPIVGAILIELTRTVVQIHSAHAELVVGVIVLACAMGFPAGVLPSVEAWIVSRRGIKDGRHQDARDA